MPRIGGSPRARFAYQPEEPDDTFRGAGDIVVDIDDYRPKPAETTYELRDGEAVEMEPERDPIPDDAPFERNLALDFDDDFLNKLGDDIAERIEDAIVERQPWRDRF